jgi:hypothetical protein
VPGKNNPKRNHSNHAYYRHVNPRHLLPLATLAAACFGQEVQSPACRNGPADTTMVQAVLNTTKGGEVRLVNCKLGILAYPVLSSSLTLRVEGTLTLTAPLILPSGVNLIGSSGGSTNQFQHGPAAHVVPPAGRDAAIHVIGSGGQRIENISISYSAGPGILIDGAAQLGALVQLKNVSVLADNSAQSVPLKIDAAFWIWIEHSSFLSQTASFPASIWITSSKNTFSNAGMIYISDTVLAGHGIKLDAQVKVNSQGGMSLDRVTYEGGLNSFLRADSTNGLVTGLFLNFITIADSTKVPYIIEEISSRPSSIRAVSIQNSSILSTIPVSNVSITGLNYQVDDSYDYATGYTLGATQQAYASIRRGVFDGEWDGSRTANQLQPVPFATLPVQQDATQWALLAGGATVATGKMAPDGSATAAELTVTTGSDGKTVYRAAPAMGVGDWILAGAWVRSEDSSKSSPVSAGNGPLMALNPGAGLFANGLSYAKLDGDLARRIGSRWSYVWSAQKISVLSGASELILRLTTDSTHPASFWMPWMARIPAGTMSDEDVLRYARSVGSLPSTMPPGGGLVALPAHQKVYFGSDVDLYRGSPGKLTTDGNIQVRGVAASSGSTHPLCSDDQGNLVRCP